jgi:hypothetical protein
MEHSDEYYKMKYFKYKAKYIAELERQKGGSKSKSSPKKNESSGLGKLVSAVGKGFEAIASVTGKGFKALAKKSTNKKEVIQALKELNDIYIEIFPNKNDNEFINYLKDKDKITIKTTITDFKKYLDTNIFTDKNMKKLKFKDARIKAKKTSYEILDRECTPYFGREIQESCTKIFQDNII